MSGFLRRLPQALVALAAAGVVTVGLLVGFSQGGPPVEPDRAVDATGRAAASAITGAWPGTPVSTTPTSFLVADAARSTVDLFSAPDVPLADGPTIDNPTWEGLPVVFLVLEDKGPWLHVRVSRRPNETTAWIKRDQVLLRRVPNRVVIEVGARRVTVYHGDTVLLQETVAVGSDRTPTPLGHFFVDGAVDVPSDTGPYGAFQVSVAGFSNVLQSFGGGVGQIAMHGTNRPELLGQAVSNGCIRMTNDAITKMVQLAPTGTPVTIVA